MSVVAILLGLAGALLGIIAGLFGALLGLALRLLVPLSPILLLVVAAVWLLGKPDERASIRPSPR
jgi:hypothetical protein